MRGVLHATIIALALIAFTAGEMTPSATAIDCGGVHTAKAKSHPKHGRAPLAIGDSTMLVPIPPMSKRGFSVNAQGCRTPSQGIKLMRSIRKDGRLPHLVIVYLGTNGKMTRGKIDQMRKVLGRSRVLGLVTGPAYKPSTGTGAIRKAHRKHPRNVIVLDWWKHRKYHPDWTYPDHHHPTPKGAAAFAKFLVRAKAYEKKGSFPG